MSNEVQRLTIDMDKKLWHQVGIESAKLGITKREFTTNALKEKIEKIRQKEGHSK